MICEPRKNARNRYFRVRATGYLVRHPDVSYCDDCLYQVASEQRTEHKPWGEISIERADGVCVWCKRQTTVSTGRRTGTLAEFAARANAVPGEHAVAEASEPTAAGDMRTPVAGTSQGAPGEARSETRVMDLVMHVVLLAQRDALRRARASIDKQLQEIEREIGESA